MKVTYMGEVAVAFVNAFSDHGGDDCVVKHRACGALGLV